MKVVIAGAGSVGSSIARELLPHGHEILFIEADSAVLERNDVPNAQWVVGDACEISTLYDAGLDTADVVIAATGDDKANLVLSLLARTEFGVGRTIGRVNNAKNGWMFDESWGVDVAINTPEILTALVEEAVTVGNLVRILNLRSGTWSLAAFTLPADSPLEGALVGESAWPTDTTLVAILRDDMALAPTAEAVFVEGDELFFLTTPAAERALRDTLHDPQIQLH